MKKKVISVILFLCLGIFVLQAQQVVTTSGGNASGSGGSVSYSVGQVVYTKNTGTNGSSTQGIQQPYEISVITGIEEAKDISLEMVVYPNPATDFFKLSIKNYDVENLRYQLFDINGSLLQENRIDSNEITISMQDLRPSTYFLKVIQVKKDIKTFKIIKN